MIIVMSSFSKSSVFQMLFVHTKMPAFLNSFRSQELFEKLRFRYGLVWTLPSTLTRNENEEIKLRFQISPAQCGPA